MISLLVDFNRKRNVSQTSYDSINISSTSPNFSKMFRQLLLFVSLVLHPTTAFFGSHSRLIAKSSARDPGVYSSSALSAEKAKTAFGSKLLPDFTEEEIQEMFKEFNITNFDLSKDPELERWLPTKEFFEKYGFQNNTERYTRTTSDVKREFYANYRNPILPQYKTFIADLMTIAHIQTIDSRFKYDALYAFGLCTQYYTIMKGYALSDEVRLSL